jgi:hypothetical protein
MADIYLEVRKRRGAYIFWMKQVPVELVHENGLFDALYTSYFPLMRTVKGIILESKSEMCKWSINIETGRWIGKLRKDIICHIAFR